MHDIPATLISLWPGHVLWTMLEEHRVLLQAVIRLQTVNDTLQAGTPVAMDQMASELVELSGVFLDAESHHEREEKVLFPQLELFGLEGPPAMMCEEHIELRQKKQALSALAKSATAISQDELTKALHPLACDLVGALRDHIEREDTILYPEALELIQDESDWQDMKSACDAIGYCQFTPTAG